METKTINTVYGDVILIYGRTIIGQKSADGMTPQDPNTFEIKDVSELVDGNLLINSDKFDMDYLGQICDQMACDDIQEETLDEKESKIIMNFDKYLSYDEREYIEHLLKSEFHRPSTHRSDSAIIISIAKKLQDLGFCKAVTEELEKDFNFHYKS